MGLFPLALAFLNPCGGCCSWQMWTCLLVIYPQGLRNLKGWCPGEPAQGICSTLWSRLVNIHKGKQEKWVKWFWQHMWDNYAYFFHSLCKLKIQYSSKNIPSLLFARCYILQWQSFLRCKTFYSWSAPFERWQISPSETFWHSSAWCYFILMFCCPLLEQMWNYTWCSTSSRLEDVKAGTF